jgi:hypothetical protein
MEFLAIATYTVVLNVCISYGINMNLIDREVVDARLWNAKLDSNERFIKWFCCFYAYIKY